MIIGGLALARFAEGYLAALSIPGPLPLVGAAVILIAAAVLAFAHARGPRVAGGCDAGAAV